MVNLVKFINFGRKLGYENVAQLRNIRKTVGEAVKKETLPTAFKGHFEFTTKQLTEMQEQSLKMSRDAITELGAHVPVNVTDKLAENHTLLQRMLKLGRKYAPKAYADDAKYISDIGFKRTGQKSGIIEINTNNSTNSVSNKIKIFFNQAGLRFKQTGASEVGSIKTDMVLLRNGKAKNPEELLKKLEIQSDGNVASITLPKTNVGKAIAEVDMKMDANYADRLVDLASKGRFYDVSELVEQLNKAKAKI